MVLSIFLLSHITFLSSGLSYVTMYDGSMELHLLLTSYLVSAPFGSFKMWTRWKFHRIFPRKNLPFALTTKLLPTSRWFHDFHALPASSPFHHDAQPLFTDSSRTFYGLFTNLNLQCVKSAQFSHNLSCEYRSQVKKKKFPPFSCWRASTWTHAYECGNARTDHESGERKFVLCRQISGAK